MQDILYETSIPNLDVIHRIAFMAVHAVVPVNTAMKLQYVFAPCCLMEPVNVLGDDSSELPHLFQSGQGIVGFVWFGIGVKQVLAIVIKKDLRLCHEKIMTQQYFRGIAIGLLGLVDAVLAAEIGDTAFRIA